MQPPAHGVAGSETVNAGNSIKVQRPEIKNFLLRFLDDEAPLVQKIVPPGRCGRKRLLSSVNSGLDAWSPYKYLKGNRISNISAPGSYMSNNGNTKFRFFS